MEEPSLPREIQLIIDDIVQQNAHLLEWEVFGNTTEDMRIVMTWRRIEVKNEKALSRNRWKLNRSSIDIDEGLSMQEQERLLLLHESNKSQMQSDEKSKLDKKGRGKSKFGKDGKFGDKGEENEDDWQSKMKKKKLSKYQKVKDESTEEKDAKDELTEDENKDLDGEGDQQLDGEGDQQLDSEGDQQLDGEGDQQLDGEGDQQLDGDLQTEDAEEEKKRREKKWTDSLEEGGKRLDGGIDGQLDDINEIKPENDTIVDPELDGQMDGVDDINKLINEDETGNEGGDMGETGNIDGNDTDELNKLGIDQNIGEISEETLDESDITTYADLNADNADNILDISADDLQTEKEGGDDEENKKNREKKWSDSCEDGSNKSRIKREVVDFKGIEVIKPKSKDQAKKMMQMQREVFRMSIDQAGLDYFDRKQMCSDISKESGGYKFDLSSMSREVGDFGFKFSGIAKRGDSFEYQYNTSNFQQNLKKIRSKSDEKKRSGYRHRAVMRDILPVSGRRGWEGCLDCRYNDFCDNNQHKDEYIHMLFADAQRNPEDDEDEPDCRCNVCKGGAVHNGCFYRELLRLKTEYRIFDKRNYCYCTECIPFKYRRMCLRQEMIMWRREGKDNYYRLTNHDDDGIIRYHEFGSEDSLDSNYHSDEQEAEVEEIDAMNLDDIDIEITQEDKISFIECGDCQCNGFCDDIRHKKLYQILVRIDEEDFEGLEEECTCMVCEFDGAAHSGCVEREMKRLKYDLMLFDIRNMCSCHECVPFKYRRICLRQQLKNMRKSGNNLYDKV